TSSGSGRDNNQNGTSRMYVDAIRFTADYELQVVGRTEITGAGGSPTHGAIAVGSFGADGLFSALTIKGSLTGSGVGVAQPVSFDAAAGASTAGPLTVTQPYNDDSGSLANLYGNNPNTQGRDFLSGVGD